MGVAVIVPGRFFQATADFLGALLGRGFAPALLPGLVLVLPAMGKL